VLIGKPSVAHSAIVLLYDPADGRIVHGHYVEVEGGDKLPDAAALERSAREAAALHASDATKALLPKLAALHTEPKGMDMRRAWKVDTAKRVLVAG
jgi:hypothetical protein